VLEPRTLPDGLGAIYSLRINDIFDLSKVEAGRLELELGRFHLPTALDNALTLIRGHGSTLPVACS